MMHSMSHFAWTLTSYGCLDLFLTFFHIFIVPIRRGCSARDLAAFVKGFLRKVSPLPSGKFTVLHSTEGRLPRLYH